MGFYGMALLLCFIFLSVPAPSPPLKTPKTITHPQRSSRRIKQASLATFFTAYSKPNRPFSTHSGVGSLCLSCSVRSK
uniref:Putative secreted protein n=1 Tax=Anopheles marajoara TaxID=58244 RepID=A0A2M4CCB3_9DIPT